MLIVPYKTDAAEQVPRGTVGLILANVVVALFLGFPGEAGASFRGPPTEEPLVNSLVLEFGTFDPVTWITSSFVHGGWLHLVGNMVFLWVFGLIVEGLIGWRRFLLVYLGIAAVASGVVELMMLSAEEGSAAGASDAISGLMAISLLWAPRNHITIWFWIFLFIRTAEITVLAFCGIWIGIELLFAFLGGFEVGTEVMHLLGAAAGLAIGYVMLKRGDVDCAGWDYFSARSGRPTRVVVRKVAKGPATPAAPRDPRIRALVRVREALEAGDGTGADLAYEAGQSAAPGWVLGRPDLLELIASLRASDQRERALARMEEFVETYPEGSAAVRLALAHRLLRADRPARALDHLAALEGTSLTDAHRAAKAQLEATARAAADRGGLELE